MKNILFLDEILAFKKQEVEQRKKNFPLEDLLEKASHQKISSISTFHEAIQRKGNEPLHFIAEIKKASPSKGVLRESFDPEKIAQIYEQNGAHAISVLTDEKFFQGHLEYLQKVSRTVNLPVLRKDFIIDAYQIEEAKAYGAKAILLIIAALDQKLLSKLMLKAKSVGLSVLVEVHDEEELQKALDAGSEIIGINNRDLKTFKVDLEVCERLRPKIPSNVTVVVESGLMNREDILRVEKLNVDAVLIGEAFMRSEDIASKMREIF